MLRTLQSRERGEGGFKKAKEWVWRFRTAKCGLCPVCFYNPPGTGVTLDRVLGRPSLSHETPVHALAKDRVALKGLIYKTLCQRGWCWAWCEEKGYHKAAFDPEQSDYICGVGANVTGASLWVEGGEGGGGGHQLDAPSPPV